VVIKYAEAVDISGRCYIVLPQWAVWKAEPGKPIAACRWLVDLTAMILMVFLIRTSVISYLERLDSEMIYYLSSSTLNSVTHSFVDNFPSCYVQIPLLTGMIAYSLDYVNKPL